MKTKEYYNIKTPMLTDSGLETTLLFHNQIDLPHFAAFPLLNKPRYQKLFSEYYTHHLELASKYNTGFILESATWRANKDWGFKLGYSLHDLEEINSLAILQLKQLKLKYSNDVQPIVISGCIGPRTDGYKVINAMTASEAAIYHNMQVACFKSAGADLTTALTINYSEEGLGIARAAKENNLPVVISFTVETDGALPSGELLKDAIYKIDRSTGSYPLYYMINCAHPSHFSNILETNSDWVSRIKGIRANASCKSHAELDESNEIDSGDKFELANWYTALKKQLPELRIYGGCCGTDVGHIETICKHFAC